VQACAYWRILKTIRPPRGQQVQVVRGNSGSNTGASPPSQQLAEIPAVGALEERGNSNGLESYLMQVGMCVGAVFHRDM